MGTQDIRTVLDITKGKDGKLAAAWYTIDQSPDSLLVEAVSAKNGTLTFAVPDFGGTYNGKLSADGRTIVGALSQGATYPLNFVRPPKTGAWAVPPSPHTTQFVTTSDHVRLEVVDWGGTGRPLVFLAGLGATAHVFDPFAPQFKSRFHVYGVTRRGFGLSDRPDPAVASYSASRLGDDVLDVIDALELDRPVLAGWSMAGSEMSSIGSRHPEKVAGLIYLDAAYGYAFYAPGNDGNLFIDANALLDKIHRLNTVNTRGLTVKEYAALEDELLTTDLPQLQADLLRDRLGESDFEEVTPPPPPPSVLQGKILDAIRNGVQKQADIKPPILAIFAIPPATGHDTNAGDKKYFDRVAAETRATAKRFEAGNPSARVVRIPDAQHAVFLSNPDEVTRQMNAFLDELK